MLLLLKRYLGFHYITLSDLAYEVPFQSVITFNHSLNEDRLWSTRRPRRKLKVFCTLLCSWLIYIILPVALVLGIRFGKGSGTICRTLIPGTEFLLNTDVPTAGNISFSQMYLIRQQQAQKPVKWLDWNERNGLLWDDYESQHQYNYWPLANMDDFIAQVNWVGYHDICMTDIQLEDVEKIIYRENRHKGFTHVYPGHADRNGTARNPFEMLAAFESDRRFNQLVDCLVQWFNVTKRDLMNEYRSIRELVSQTSTVYDTVDAIGNPIAAVFNGVGTSV